MPSSLFSDPENRNAVTLNVQYRACHSSVKYVVIKLFPPKRQYYLAIQAHHSAVVAQGLHVKYKNIQP
jgi:hypothetical protein